MPLRECRQLPLSIHLAPSNLFTPAPNRHVHQAKPMQKHPSPVIPSRQEPESPETKPDAIPTEPILTSPLSLSALILAVLAVIAALYVGKEVVLPIAFAIVLKLLLQPLLDFLHGRLHLPMAVGALIIIVGLFGAIGTIVFTVSGPASGWIQKAPEVLPSLKDKLVVLRQPLDYMQQAFKQVEEVATPGGQDGTPTVAVKDQSAIARNLAAGTLLVLERLFTTMVILFFLLAAGDRLLRGLIEVLPTFSDKRQAVDIANEIQRQIGGYLLTITVMNSLVGILTGLTMWYLGLGDPILWGAAAFLLNYVPILGPLTGIGVFLVAGILTLDWPWLALLPAGIYGLIHIAEGEIITPMLLSKRFTLNPVLVIVSLFFWHFVWGIAGALLAVPLLAIFKILCDRIKVLQPAGHIIGS
jgi:predicted PurR-regulated permease PerM